ncbi:tryptophan-rich sensory protein [Eubacteriaceae bacterium ES2]|nr:tryptophan-rich sensory protein [Eubacteriaceae bacterium ES2]
MNQLVKAIIGLDLLIATLVINGLGAYGFFNGMSQKAISDMYPTLITPAPFTFSIWSIIYLLLIGAAITMIIKSKDDIYSEAIDQIAPLFWISSGLNMVWIICFSFNLIGLSAAVILGFAIVLSLIAKRISLIRIADSWLLPSAFGMYAGWLLIATVVNIAAFLISINWQGFGIGAEIWSVLTLAVAVILAFLVAHFTRNFVIPLPIAWAISGFICH